MTDPATDLGFLSLFPADDSDEELEYDRPRELSTKELRIQRAIDEGKRTYGRGQAETSARWFANEEVIKAKAPEEKQQQRFREFHAASLYERREIKECLAVCTSLLSIPGYDNREVVDMGLRCCLKLKDKDAGEGLARGCRSMWMTTPHLAMSSAEVFIMADLPAESVKALACALTARTVQYPPLALLFSTLASWSTSPSSPSSVRQAAARLAKDVQYTLDLSQGLASAFSRPLFSLKKTRREKLDPEASSVDKVEPHTLLDDKELEGCCADLGLDARTTGRMHVLWSKCAGIVRRGDVVDEVEEDNEGGVRSL